MKEDKKDKGKDDRESNVTWEGHVAFDGRVLDRKKYSGLYRAFEYLAVRDAKLLKKSGPNRTALK